MAYLSIYLKCIIYIYLYLEIELKTRETSKKDDPAGVQNHLSKAKAYS